MDPTHRFAFPKVASLALAVALLGAGSTALKPINQDALQTMVDATAKELLVPGAVVFLRTPQGEFTVAYGTTSWARRARPTPAPTSESPRIPRR
jgi:hypothetical protein